MTELNNSFLIDTTTGWKDYELLDSGNGKKLERYGPYRLIRPEAEAIWIPALSKNEWTNADAEFLSTSEKMGGHWEFYKKIPESWEIGIGQLSCRIKISASKHLGVFPEQAGQWEWIQNVIRNQNRPVKVLNLFGYTALASLAAANAGASVTHVDASKKAIGWGKENQQLSGLSDRSVRWIVDDALKFVKREIRRASFYDAVILDPPKFGRGPKGEVWEFYKLISDLFNICRDVLSDQPLFVLVTAYAVKVSSITLSNALAEKMKSYSGRTEFGEVCLQDTSADRRLPMSVFARWLNSN